MSRYLMAIDAAKCINCKACVMACMQRNFVPLGQSRNWVLQTLDQQDKQASGYYFQPGACMQCTNPLCTTACPTGATKQSQDGIIRIDPEMCIGCGACIAACPYNARFRNSQTGIAEKCDYCADGLSQGKIPACVSACPTRVRTFGDLEQKDSPIAQLVARAESKFYIKPATGEDPKPSLVYLSATEPKQVLKESKLPESLELFTYCAQGVKILGALSLFGVIGVFIKQIFWPSENSADPDNHPGV